MEFALTKDTPVSKWWKPKLIFTGVSIMGINPDTRRFNRSCPSHAAARALPPRCWHRGLRSHWRSFKGFSAANMCLSWACTCARLQVRELSCFRR